MVCHSVAKLARTGECDFFCNLHTFFVYCGLNNFRIWWCVGVLSLLNVIRSKGLHNRWRRGSRGYIWPSYLPTMSDTAKGAVNMRETLQINSSRYFFSSRESVFSLNGIVNRPGNRCIGFCVVPEHFVLDRVYIQKLNRSIASLEQ